jgi:hypothetical protein
MAAKTSYHRNFSFGTPRRILSRFGKLFILTLTLVLASSYLLAADPVRSNPGSDRTSNGTVSGSITAQARYRVFALKHITSEQAKKLLVEAKLGTVSQLPAANMLLVTAQPRQLIKASAILKLVDTKTPVVMKAILPASAAGNLPSIEQIAAEVGNILIGSFSSPPSGVGKAKAIIDIHNDAVMAIAPADKIEEIVAAIKGRTSDSSITQLQESKAEAFQRAQPENMLEPVQKEGPKVSQVAEAELEKVKTEHNHRNGTSEARQEGAESNGLFGKLLDSLNDAETKVAKLAQPALNGPGPDANVIASDKATSKDSADSEQAEEIAVEANQPPKKPDVEAVSEKPEDTKKPAEPPKKPDVTAVTDKPKDTKKTVEPPKKVDVAVVSEKPEDTKKAVELPKKPVVNVLPEKSVKKPGAEKIVSKKIQPKPAPKQVETKKPGKAIPTVSEKPDEATKAVESSTAFQTYQPGTYIGFAPEAQHH